MLAFEYLKTRAAAGRNVRELLSESKLFNGSRGIAATSNRDRTLRGCVGAGLRDRASASIERRHFKDAHGPVPNNRAALAHCLRKCVARCRTNVKPHQPIGNRTGHDRRRRVRFELRCADVVCWKEERAAPGLRLREQCTREFNAVCLDAARARRNALRAQEGVRHCASDDDAIHLRHEVLDRENLVGNLRAAEDRRERSLGRRDAPVEVLQFSGEQEASHTRAATCAHGKWKRMHRGIRAMARAKRVVHVQITE